VPTGVDVGVVAARLFAALADRVFDIAGNVMRSAFGFVDFTLALHFFVAGQLAGRVLHRTFGLFRGSFDVFPIHWTLLCDDPVEETGQSSRSFPATAEKSFVADRTLQCFRKTAWLEGHDGKDCQNKLEGAVFLLRLIVSSGSSSE
jgi:hypothetical protein